MKAENSEATKLYRWVPVFFDCSFCLMGSLDSAPGLYSKGIRTSSVIAVDKLLVCTTSGSRYLLEEPHEFCEKALTRNLIYPDLELSAEHTLEEFLLACLASPERINRKKKEK